MGRALKRGLAATLLLLTAACNHKTLTVESDTNWQADISGFGSFGGSGREEINLDAAPDNFCWTVKKLTSAGTLRAYLHHEDWLGLRSEYIADGTTTAPGGEVGGCV